MIVMKQRWHPPIAPARESESGRDFIRSGISLSHSDDLEVMMTERLRSLL
jgi:hypothetical protein